MSRRAALGGAGAVLLVGVLIGALCAARVPEGSLGLVVRGGKVVSVVGAGLDFRRPFDTVVIVPSGRREFAGSIRVRSREGAALETPFHLALDLSAADASGLARVAGGLLAGQELETVVAGLVEEAAASSTPGAGEPVAAIAARLAGLGLAPGSLTLGAGSPAAAEAPNPLRGAWKAPPWGLLVIGIDSADWDLMTPLMESGALPNLRTLRDRGAWGTLRSMRPTLSPILWTTIATGRKPEDHGIIDFLMKDPATGTDVPISRLFRRVKALWNIASDLEIPNTTVAWWATWPAERVTGSMVTDRVAYSLFDLPAAAQAPAMAYPESVARQVEALRVDAESVSYEELRAIADVPQEAFERARQAIASSEGYHDPVSHLIRVLASTGTYHRIAMDLLARQRGGLALVYYQGLDEANHRFAHYMPPALGLTRGTDPALAAAFAKVVPGFYRLQDRLVGDLVGAMPPDTVVVVVSDHGFANGAERPIDVPPDIEGKPGLWHTLDGVLIVAGPPVKAGHFEARADLLDVAPTLLALLGLPVASDMPGRPIEEIFRPGAAPAPPQVAIASYDAIGAPLQGAGFATSSPEDAEMIAKLQALGYVQSGPANDPAAGTGTPIYHINAGHIFLAKGDLDRAEESFERARRIAPRFDQPLLGLAQVQLMRGRAADALPFLEQALAAGPEPQPALLTRAAQVYLKAGRQTQGIAFLDGLRMTGRREAFRLTAIGMLHEDQGRADAALAAFREALAMDPSVERALFGAYRLLKKRADFDDLAALLEKSLDVESVPVAVRAANWLALTRELQGRRPEAREILKKALLKAPDDVMTLTNLGSMLVRDDLSPEGIGYLERAYGRQPRNFEVLVNLVVARGKLGDLEKARAYFREAGGGGGGERPELLNAMAYACYLNGQRREAETLLARSLAIEPGQEGARRLREEIARGGGS